MTRARLAVLVLITLALFGWMAPDARIPPLVRFDPGSLLADAAALSSDLLEGRGAGTAGLEAAAELIQARMRACGVAPAGVDGGYLQPFGVTAPAEVGAASSLTLRDAEASLTLHPGAEWRATGFSAAGRVRGPLVHVGGTLPLGESADLEAAVLLVHGGSHGADLRLLATAARERGASAIVAAALPADPGGDTLSGGTEWNVGDAGLPVIRVRYAAIETMLTRAGVSPETLRAQPTVATPLRGIEVELILDVTRRPAELRNVVGMIPGTGDAGSLVLGAHYDHLGRGEVGSLASAEARGTVHPGADDNASGVAVTLAVACEIARAPRAHTVVAALFAGEEIGLLGSAHYVEHPAVPLADTIAMINLDMVGRLRRNRLVAFGTGSARELPALLRGVERATGLDLASQRDGIGPSDHTSFFLKQRPVVHFFTGAHEDYHRPSDQADRLNAPGMARIATAVLATIDTLSTHREPLRFVAASERSPARGGGYGAYLGTVPEFGRSTSGVQLAAVRDASPAYAAGLRPGDVIIGLGGVAVNDLYDLTYALRSHAGGDRVVVEYLRAGRRRRADAVLAERR